MRTTLVASTEIVVGDGGDVTVVCANKLTGKMSHKLDQNFMGKMRRADRGTVRRKDLQTLRCTLSPSISSPIEPSKKTSNISTKKAPEKIGRPKAKNYSESELVLAGRLVENVAEVHHIVARIAIERFVRRGFRSQLLFGVVRSLDRET